MIHIIENILTKCAEIKVGCALIKTDDSKIITSLYVAQSPILDIIEIKSLDPNLLCK